MQRPSTFPDGGYGPLHDQIFDALISHPEGISINEMRSSLDLDATAQQHLDRRLRQLYDYYVIKKKRRGRETLYIIDSLRPIPKPRGNISQTTRYRILQRDGHRCQSCGRTAHAADVTLHVDHKLPLSWGGLNDDDNLWTLCAECNLGKKDFFNAITDPRTQRALTHASVHVRIGEMLKAYEGEWIPKSSLAVVAWTHDDWEKRMRELRVLGWDYEYKREIRGERVTGFFRIKRWTSWPEDPAREIRRIEEQRKVAKKH